MEANWGSLLLLVSRIVHHFQSPPFEMTLVCSKVSDSGSPEYMCRATLPIKWIRPRRIVCLPLSWAVPLRSPAKNVNS